MKFRFARLLILGVPLVVSQVAAASDPVFENVFVGRYEITNISRDCELKGYEPKGLEIPFPSPLLGLQIREGRAFTIGLEPCKKSPKSAARNCR